MQHDDFTHTAPAYLASVDGALKAAGLKTKVAGYVSGNRYGLYATDRLRTSRGGHILVKWHLSIDGRVYLKSVCKVRDKWQSASLLINGQAGTNAVETAWFAEGDGPEFLIEAA